jgi:Ca2+-transporting ATPase
MSATPIYSLRVPEVCEALETSSVGLSNAEAEARLSLYGHNLLSKQKKEPVWEKLLREFIHPPALVLLIVGLAALLQHDGVLALIIWGIIVVNTGFSFWREYRAEQAIEKLREILPSFAHVIREGMESYLPSS